jgi:hypothetical protein
MLEVIDPAPASTPAGGRRGSGLRLFTAVIRVSDANGILEIFHACKVASAAQVRLRLAARLGCGLAGIATVREGMDPLHPVAVALLTADTARQLAERGDLEGGALAGGGDLHIVQRKDR